MIVTSTAIPDTNPEVVRAHELGIPIWPRAKMLSYLSGSQRTVAVAGTHGKTTTSSMVATMLDRMGLDPSFLIGGVVEGYDTNGRNGRGEHFVCEADESDGSFLYLNPSVVVVTNIEADHLDHYGTLENIERTFCTFMGLVGERARSSSTVTCRTTSSSPARRAAAWSPTALTSPATTSASPRRATTRSPATSPSASPAARAVHVTISSNPGRHNMANATAAIAVADVPEPRPVDAAAEALSPSSRARVAASRTSATWRA